MSYHYIALVDCSSGHHAFTEPGLLAILQRQGFYETIRLGPAILCISDRTPFVQLSDTSVLIGQAFFRSGEPICEPTQLTTHPTDTQFQKYFLENCWGSYLIFQQSPCSQERITTFRDPEGGVACIYSISAGKGFITSDIRLPKRLGIYRRRVDWNHIAHRLTYPQLKTRRTGLLHVDELPPGSRLTVDKLRSSVDNLWSPWDFVAKSKRHFDLQHAAADIRQAIDTVIHAWARADGHTLVELSGGLDSSIVGVSLHRAGVHMTCCTYVTPIPGADERRYAHAVADQLGTELDVQHLPLEGAQLQFSRGAHLPTARVGMLQNATDAIMENAALRHNTNSYMSGAGGDTVFCYLPTAAPAADALSELGLAGGIAAIRQLSELHQCTLWRAARLTVRKSLKQPASPYLPSPHLLSSEITGHSAERHPWLDIPPTALSGDRERIIALAIAQTYRDGAPRGTDRHLRFPLLSQPVMEATLRAPAWMWITGGRNRAIARLAYAKELPSMVLNRRSKGTFTAYVGTLLDRNRKPLREFILEGELSARGFLDRDATRNFIDSTLTPRDDSFEQIFDLCAVENWIRHQS